MPRKARLAVFPGDNLQIFNSCDQWSESLTTSLTVAYRIIYLVLTGLSTCAGQMCSPARYWYESSYPGSLFQESW